MLVCSEFLSRPVGMRAGVFVRSQNRPQRHCQMQLLHILKCSYLTFAENVLQLCDVRLEREFGFSRFDPLRCSLICLGSLCFRGWRKFSVSVVFCVPHWVNIKSLPVESCPDSWGTHAVPDVINEYEESH